MTTATWPPTLQTAPLWRGYGEQRQSGKLRTDMDIGPAKQRRRFTSTVDPFSVVLDLKRDEVETLLAFHDITLSRGVLSFLWVHPRTGEPATCRFVDEPSVKGNDKTFLVTFTIEVLP